MDISTDPFSGIMGLFFVCRNPASDIAARRIVPVKIFIQFFFHLCVYSAINPYVH